MLHGIHLAPGDEAVMCNQDYGTMLEQFPQQSRRRGLRCVPEDDLRKLETAPET